MEMGSAGEGQGLCEPVRSSAEGGYYAEEGNKVEKGKTFINRQLMVKQSETIRIILYVNRMREVMIFLH